MSLNGRLHVPAESAGQIDGNAVAALIAVSELNLAVGIAALGGLPDRLETRSARSTPLSLAVYGRQQLARLLVSAGGQRPQRLQRAVGVLGNAGAAVIHARQVETGISVALCRRLPIPGLRLEIILLHPPSLLVTLADEIHRFGIAAFRRFAVKMERVPGIPPHAFAALQHASGVLHRFDVALQGEGLVEVEGGAEAARRVFRVRAFDIERLGGGRGAQRCGSQGRSQHPAEAARRPPTIVTATCRGCDSGVRARMRVHLIWVPDGASGRCASKNINY